MQALLVIPNPLENKTAICTEAHMSGRYETPNFDSVYTADI